MPIRLGIFALYSTKKVSIFNKTMVDILESYAKRRDSIFKQENYYEVLERGDERELENIEFQLYFFDHLAKTPKIHATYAN